MAEIARKIHNTTALKTCDTVSKIVVGNFCISSSRCIREGRERSCCAEAVRIMRVLDKLKHRLSNRINAEGRGCQSLRDFDRRQA
eukprot:14184-Heterococcus_DN1.PRE.3